MEKERLKKRIYKGKNFFKEIINMNWYKTARLADPYHKYRKKEEIDMNDLCRPDNESIKNIQNLINEDNSLRDVHEMGTTKAFRSEVEPILMRMETPEFKKKIKPILYEDALAGKFGGNYWEKQWASSFSKFLWPKLKRCKEDYLRTFLKGDWNALAKMIYDDTERYISAKLSASRKKPPMKLDINPYQIWSKNPIISTQMKNIGVSHATFANYIYNDIPEGVQQLYKNQDWQGVANIITQHIEPYKTRQVNKQQLQEIYNETIAQDEFARQYFSFDRFLTLVAGKPALKDRTRRPQMILQELIKRGETDKIVFIINNYLRSSPKITYPIIYKQFVQPVVPEWDYKSFVNVVNNNKSIKAAIANEDNVVIEQFVEAYRKKIQEGNYYSNPPSPRQPREIQPRRPQKTAPYVADPYNIPDMAFASAIRKNIKK